MGVRDSDELRIRFPYQFARICRKNPDTTTAEPARPDTLGIERVIKDKILLRRKRTRDSGPNGAIQIGRIIADERCTSKEMESVVPNGENRPRIISREAKHNQGQAVELLLRPGREFKGSRNIIEIAAIRQAKRILQLKNCDVSGLVYTNVNNGQLSPCRVCPNLRIRGGDCSLLSNWGRGPKPKTKSFGLRVPNDVGRRQNVALTPTGYKDAGSNSGVLVDRNSNCVPRYPFERCNTALFIDRPLPHRAMIVAIPPQPIMYP